jgi:endo-1,3(4)-beta-glucanase
MYNKNTPKKEDYIIINDLDSNLINSRESKRKNIVVILTTFVSIFLLWFISLKIKDKDFSILSTNRITFFESVTNNNSPTNFWGNIKKPYPTNAFFTNIVVNEGDGSILVTPYGVKTVHTGIHISYGPTRRIVTSNSIIDVFDSDIEISSIEKYQTHRIEKYDNISVTMNYYTLKNGKYKAHLVKGSPYITIEYENCTPVLSSLMHVLSIKKKDFISSIGTQYIITLGNYQKWLIYCTEKIIFNLNNDIIISSKAITGILRVAFLPLQKIESSYQILMKYVNKYPIGAEIIITYPSINTSKIKFKFNVVGTGDLLMLALPHHIESMICPKLSDKIIDARNKYEPILSMKGKLLPIIGDSFDLFYKLPDIKWNYVSIEEISTNQLETIIQNLLTDVKSIIPSATDPYGFGKEIARMAQIANIADNVDVIDVKNEAINNIKTTIEPWLLVEIFFI